ncbi:hypothetical protein OAM69_01990 [bacterium]|nr:hypothetical protein [bacterium]
MKAITIFLYSLSFGLSLAILPTSVFASEFANIHINGETVPEELFRKYSEFNKHLLCAPASDAYVIQEVVTSKLVIDEGIRQAVVPNRDDARTIERHQRSVDNRPAGSTDTEQADERYWLFDSKNRGYGNALAGEITFDDTMEHYRQLILEKDPRLVNVTLLSIVNHQFASKAQRDLALDKLALGQSIEEVIAANDFGSFNPFQADRWITINESRVLWAEDATIQAGTVFVPDWDPNTHLIRIVDTKVISRIRPFQVMERTSDWYARHIATDDLRKRRLAAIIEPLLEDALVTRNEEPIKIGELQSGCDAK